MSFLTFCLSCSQLFAKGRFIGLSSMCRPLTCHSYGRHRDHPSANTVVPGPKAAREIIHRWSPFNKRESSVPNMLDLDPTVLRVPVVLRSTPFPFPSTWIGSPSSAWPKTGCTSATTTLTSQLSWYVSIFNT